MFDHLYTRSKSIADLEIGGYSSEDDEGSSGEKADKKLNGFWRSGSLSSIRMTSDDSLSSSGNVEILEREGGEMVKNSTDNGLVKEKRKKGMHKPPRPPRGPLLDAADMKWLREMSELGKLKHARFQRMKAMKKRSERASSSSNTIFPMVVTVVFFCVLLFQVIFECPGSVPLENVQEQNLIGN
ncbi:conserved hypothetical protein [Ricinus communis]|uniref:Transmembrane protein n=1 Tax=Ricinus communis TaxID=3988 RepID=B9RFK6_RICCO|nr:conserved hypothetical protein [Ricinus communis]